MNSDKMRVGARAPLENKALIEAPKLGIARRGLATPLARRIE